MCSENRTCTNDGQCIIPSYTHARITTSTVLAILFVGSILAAVLMAIGWCTSAANRKEGHLYA